MTISITKCEGGLCPFKTDCYRYERKADKIKDRRGNSEYFTKPPFKIIHGKPDCEMYWGDKAEYLFRCLQEVVKPYR